MVTYNELYLDTRRALRAAGIEAAPLEAKELVCCASGKSKEQLLRDRALYAPEPVGQALSSLLERRLAGEPVAYLIGAWEFYGLTLEVTPSVLIPRVDTEVLAGLTIALARAAGEGARVLDLCAGSGCIGLAAAVYAPGCRVVLADCSEDALHVCRQNIRRNHLHTRVTCVAVDASLPPDPALGEFDVIACNPPYIPTGDLAGLDAGVRDYEPRLALDGGADGFAFYRCIPGRWKRVLRQGGSLLFEVGVGQARQVRRLLCRAGYRDVRAWRDTAGIWRVVGGTAGPAPGGL